MAETCRFYRLINLNSRYIVVLFTVITLPVNPLNAELNHICHLVELLGAHPILHVSRIRVNQSHKSSLLAVRSKACNTHYIYLFVIQTWQEVVVAYYKPLCLQSPNELRKITINRSQGGGRACGNPNFRACVASSK